MKSTCGCVCGPFDASFMSFAFARGASTLLARVPCVACLVLVRRSPLTHTHRDEHECINVLLSGRISEHLYRVLMGGTTRTKAQLGLGQIGLLQIGDRSTVAIRCSLRTTVANLDPKCPYYY